MNDLINLLTAAIDGDESAAGKLGDLVKEAGREEEGKKISSFFAASRLFEVSMAFDHNESSEIYDRVFGRPGDALEIARATISSMPKSYKRLLVDVCVFEYVRVDGELKRAASHSMRYRRGRLLNEVHTTTH